MKKWKKNALGCLEIALFMEKGVERFSGSVQGCLRSFLVMFAIMPLTYLALYLKHPQDQQISYLSFELVAFMFFLKAILVLVLGLTVLYGFARYYNHEELLLRTITANNWITIVPTLLFMPLLYGMAIGEHSWEEIYPLTVVIAIYSYAMTAFLFTHALRIPWEMAGFLTICGLAINETSFDLLYYVAESLKSL